MKRLGAGIALVTIFLAGTVPAFARDFVQDGASMFSSSTVSSLDSRIGAFNAQTGKEIVVLTVPSLNGQSLTTAAQQAFSQQGVNGLLIYVSKGDRKDIIVPGQSTAAFFPPETLRAIRQSMEAQFKAEDYDGGITTAVDGIFNVFRAHMNSRPGAAGVTQTYGGRPSYATNSGVHISMFWWIVIFFIGFMVVRSIMRSMSGPRMYGGGPGMGGPGYGGPGYGGGYYGGGGGGFWSGLLGGLGGAWLGNEMFGNRGGGNIVDPGSNVASADQGGSWGGGGDSSGWGNDAGQANMGGSSAGDFGGGGWGDSGGGGGDFGGGGGGGGGDSGGGW